MAMLLRPKQPVERKSREAKIAKDLMIYIYIFFFKFFINVAHFSLHWFSCESTPNSYIPNQCCV